MTRHAHACGKASLAALSALVLLLGLHGLAAADDDRARLTDDVKATIARFVKADPSVAAAMQEAAGYAVFPGVGKGAIGVGGAHGTGQVYGKGAPLAKASLTQLTIGLQLGGQKYSELILFADQATLDTFLRGAFTMAAQVSAVAAASGAAANAKYAHGVKVMTLTVGGLMYEASVGGQKFNVERY